MRKRKKVRKTTSCEATFLRERREAVGKAASGTKDASQPAWMAGLAKKLWSEDHSKERKFNQNKRDARALKAYKDGLLEPPTKGKRKLDRMLADEEEAETIRRKNYFKRIAKCNSAAG